MVLVVFPLVWARVVVLVSSWASVDEAKAREEMIKSVNFIVLASGKSLGRDLIYYGGVIRTRVAEEI
jgi:hypothetical protein